jgi:hypothetical protein
MRTLLALAVLAVSAAAQTPAARGLSGTITMTLQPPAIGSATQASSSLSGTALFVTGKGRVDITRAAGPATDFRAGDYILLPDSARALYMRPPSQEYWTMDSPFLSPWAALGAMTSQISAGSATTSLERLGNGDTVATFPTQRFRINAEYTMTAGEMRIPAGITIEITVARTPHKFAGAPIAGAQSFGMTSPAGLSSRLAAHLAEIAAEGTIVRASSNTWFNASGTTLNLVVTTELSDIREVDADSAKFALPAGYRHNQ